MPRGGARNRSGPPADPNSLRSDKRGLTFRHLPPEGYDGDVPRWPLPELSEREDEVWQSLWRTPQAAAWADEPWRWHTIALYARWLIRMEDREASAALGNVVVRYGDQIGMTPAGLRDNGWIVGATVEAEDGEPVTESVAEAARNRLKVA